jgi:GNAT superfamily N-acetyltransferase
MTIRELEPPETAGAFAAMRVLRPHLADADELVRRVDAQRAEGYRLIAVVEGDGSVSAVAGFRIHDMLSSGRIVYIDDLSTLPAARGRGYGRALLDWCADEGRRLGCKALHLDSGVGADRQDAHRLYFNAGMRIRSFHFSRPL